MARIAVDARPLSTATTGIGRYTRAILERIVNSEHEWYFYSHKPLMFDFSAFSNVKIRSAGTGSTGLSSVAAQCIFPLWAHQDRIQVFWSPRHHLPLLMSKRVRKVVTIHDLVWRKYPKTMSFLGLQLERLLMPGSLRVADKIISVSNSTAIEIDECFSECSDKVETIYEAPYLSVANEKDLIGDYFLFVGTIEPRKNLLRLLEAYQIYFKETENPLPLKICGGKGWGLPELNDKVNELGIAGLVEILGYIDDEAMLGLYQKARALVIPSLYEGFGLPIVEAYSQGTPVLTSNRGAMAEIAADGGVFVDPEDCREIAEAMNMLTTDIEKVKTLQELALFRAKQFSWDVAAKNTLDLLEGVASKASVNY